ncbi:MAG TPA: ankyrin repeat domain-containing protein, partial [Vicinamibacterales bacterium]|nr:ankyrin repeat domain-containing protein [Vicinamibacterales bacterium]
MKTIAAGLLSISLSVASSGVAAADTRLLDAVARGDRTAVRELLRNHADVNSAQADGSTALMLAVERNDVELATLLVRAQARVNAANDYGATA